ncbi:MAG: terminase TerL endonuclease subunit [Planctomycetota bacterium]
MSVDVVTKRWMRDASDELAVANGCRFDEGLGQFVVDWMYDYLRLYEGVWAGRPFECRDWQYEFVMRCFGWMRPNVDWREELPNRDYIRRFRGASVWIPKKNKKSPTLAALMLYMLCGDDVMGQKCFPGAKDGQQVRKNVMLHVVEMVKQSEELSAECKINLNDATVFHEPTRSLLLPLSSSNVRNEKSKEGLNGSVFVDEVHVVDRSFVRRIDRAGISRPEPLHAEFSTVGDDMDSYGYDRFQYAEGVADGSIKDDALLSMIYAAPRDLPETELAADPAKYGELANPAWGHTIKSAEFLADFERSKSSPRALADFKMYRLNVWQASATPWLSMPAWEQCNGGREIDPGKPVYAGLDLSSKRDFTAWVLVQKQGDVYVARGQYWISRDRADEHLAAGRDIVGWEREGWLSISDNARVDQEAVTERVIGDSKAIGVESIGHDRWGAEALRQQVENEGIQIVEVGQSFGDLTEPSKLLEAAVLSGELDHGGDPVLTWMARNVTIKSDNHDNIKPIKPERSTLKAVDGIVALIMGIGQAELAREEQPVTGVYAV